MRRAGLGLVAATVIGLGGCATTPPEQDPVQIRLNDLDTRLGRIERLMTNQSLLQLANEIEALRADVRGMHDEVDKLGNDLEAARKRQRDLYADLDQRLKALESRSAAAGPAGPSTTVAPAANPPAAAPRAPIASAPPDGTDRGNYQAAFVLLKDSQYDQAIAAFGKFLVDFPDSPLADNAQYWLGEAYYVNRDFPTALSAFQRVVDKYPQSRKLPDALLKVGYCQYELHQWDQARAVLTDVTSKFANTPAGRLAQQRLEKIGAEGH
ncbi:MAG: tol-pal system protein YbgF [Steroidobacterales bacterium]